MSTCFEIYPTDNNIPQIHRIIANAELMFRDFLMKYSIESAVDIKISEVAESNKIKANPKFIVSNEKAYDVITVNGTGNIYIFYYKLSDMDNEIWNDELKTNPRAVLLEYQKNSRTAFNCKFTVWVYSNGCFSRNERLYIFF